MESIIHRGWPADDYHAHPSLSSSLIGRLLQSPAHYRAALTAERKQTPAMLLGSAVHCAVLEPDDFLIRYARAPEGDGRTKAVKEAKAELAAAGVEVLAADHWDAVTGIRDAVRAHRLADTLLTNGEAELSALWTDPDAGVDCRLRADWVNTAHAQPLLVDLKTTQDASPNGFAKSCASYGYHRQHWWYCEGWERVTGEVPAFIFVAVEKEPPYAIGVYTLDDEAVAFGAEQCRQAIRTYVECVETGRWPGYAPDQIQTLSLPAWATRK